MSSNIEQRIVQLLHRNDQYALNLLYENYSDSLYGAILKVTKNEEIAEDALQETFIKVWKNALEHWFEKYQMRTEKY